MSLSAVQPMKCLDAFHNYRFCSHRHSFLPTQSSLLRSSLIVSVHVLFLSSSTGNIVLGNSFFYIPCRRPAYLVLYLHHILFSCSRISFYCSLIISYFRSFINIFGLNRFCIATDSLRVSLISSDMEFCCVTIEVSHLKPLTISVVYSQFNVLSSLFSGKFIRFRFSGIHFKTECSCF